MPLQSNSSRFVSARLYRYDCYDTRRVPTTFIYNYIVGNVFRAGRTAKLHNVLNYIISNHRLESR